MQYSVIIDLWNIVDKDVRKLLNQTLFLAFAVMVLNIGFCFWVAIYIAGILKFWCCSNQVGEVSCLGSSISNITEINFIAGPRDVEWHPNCLHRNCDGVGLDGWWNKGEDSRESTCNEAIYRIPCVAVDIWRAGEILWGGEQLCVHFVNGCCAHLHVYTSTHLLLVLGRSSGWIAVRNLPKTVWGVSQNSAAGPAQGTWLQQVV